VPGVLALLWSIREGREQVRLILSSLIRWRIPSKFYMFSLVLPAGLFWISLGFIFLRYPSGHALPSVFRVATTLLLTLPFGPLWEELAWRAYALRKLETRFTPLASALFLGLYWGVWHIPLWLTTMTIAPGMKIPVLVLACVNLIAWSVIFTFMYERSGQSLPATILLHGTYAAVATEMSNVMPQNDFALIVASSLLSSCVALILGARLRADVTAPLYHDV
jgi:membrane protease YdiL (CAAX protease family)